MSFIVVYQMSVCGRSAQPQALEFSRLTLTNEMSLVVLVNHCIGLHDYSDCRNQNKIVTIQFVHAGVRPAELYPVKRERGATQA